MFNPSSADITEIAGEISASPYTSAAPQRPMNMMTGCRSPRILPRSAISARSYDMARPMRDNVDHA